jgi:hypothetical protein
MKTLSCLLLLAFLSGCVVHDIHFIHFDTGEVLTGEFQEITRDISVTMPNGELLSGKYSAVSNDSFMFGTSFGRVGRTPVFGTSTGVSTGGASSAYALLKSEKSKLMMELIVSYSGTHGYGEARTNDGREYRVQF